MNKKTNMNKIGHGHSHSGPTFHSHEIPISNKSPWLPYILTVKNKNKINKK